MDSLFWKRDPYDIQGSDALFMGKLINNAVFQFEYCQEYRRLLMMKGFTKLVVGIWDDTRPGKKAWNE